MDLRKIDALVAEKVMEVFIEATDRCPHCGTPLEHMDDLVGLTEPAKYRCDAPGPNGYPCDWRFQVCPLYSADIAAAWQVVEKFQREEKGFRIQLHRDGKWGCHNHDDGVLLSGWDWPEGPGDGYIDEEADTAPLAICLAALCSVGIEP